MKKNNFSNYYKNKTILVTGGAGSIGSEIVKRLLSYNSLPIRVLDNNESAVFNLAQELGMKRLRPLVGDIRDERRVARAMQDVDMVFHAAALKHVPLSEYNPMDAVQTNILGTQNIINGAINAHVKKVVNISTDKAVNPINVLGATKLVAERFITNADSYRGKSAKTTFSSVRFGNVLYSNGSVIPIFRKQISEGGPVTVTSEAMTRFFMTIHSAVDLILEAGMIMRGREIFIPKMPALKIMDLARVLIGSRPIKIKVVGMRPGEKMHESLITDEESVLIREYRDKFILRYELSPIKNTATGSYRNYNSRGAHLLTRAQIKELLAKEKI